MIDSRSVFDLDRRGRLMLAVLGFLRVRGPRVPALDALHRWLDSWRGVRHIVVGMGRQGYDVQLARYDGQGWRATFYPSGIEHSATAFAGTAWEPTPWRAAQRAAWAALTVSQ